jgi:hypothetical protein
LRSGYGGSFWERLDFASEKIFGDNIDLSKTIELISFVSPMVDVGDGETAALLVAKTVTCGLIAPKDWRTLSSILRALSKNRNRVVFLKALQLLCGSDKEDIDAIELNDSELSELFAGVNKKIVRGDHEI